MNRTIKFRARSLNNGGYGTKWVYGYLFKTPLTAENFEADSFQSGKPRVCIADGQGVVYEVDPETVGQFADQLDSKGKEIYEGDILRLGGVKQVGTGTFLGLGPVDSKVEVRFENGSFVTSEATLAEVLAWHDPDVVGNISDNPSLLEKKDGGS